MTDYLSSIQQSKEQTISLIKDYVKSQKEVWQELPYLAFLADGLGGWNQYYRNCYENKYWEVEAPQGYRVRISCLTGLVTSRYSFSLLNCYIDELNASLHKNNLIKELKKGKRSYTQRPENWTETYEQYKLDKDKIIWYKLNYC